MNEKEEFKTKLTSLMQTIYQRKILSTSELAGFFFNSLTGIIKNKEKEEISMLQKRLQYERIRLRKLLYSLPKIYETKTGKEAMT